MRVYRLTKAQYKEDFSGMGAEKYGGRWNSKGTRMLYTADSRALAKLEVAVHTPLHRIPKNYYLTIIDFPDKCVVDYDVKLLAGKDWQHDPPIKFTQLVGDQFVKNVKGLVLKVPSAVVQGDFNYLINPQHADIKKVKLVGSEPFQFDMRLFK